MSTTAEPQHLGVAGSRMTPTADPTRQAAAALKMALRAVLLSGQAPGRVTGRQRPENEQDTCEARKDAGNLRPALMFGSRETNRTARFPRCRGRRPLRKSSTGEVWACFLVNSGRKLSRKGFGGTGVRGRRRNHTQGQKTRGNDGDLMAGRFGGGLRRGPASLSRRRQARRPPSSATRHAGRKYVVGLVVVPAVPLRRPCRSRDAGGGRERPPLLDPLDQHRGASACVRRCSPPSGGGAPVQIIPA